MPAVAYPSVAYPSFGAFFVDQATRRPWPSPEGRMAESRSVPVGVANRAAVLSYLEAQPDAARFSIGEVAEALGLTQGAARAALLQLEWAGLVNRKQRIAHGAVTWAASRDGTMKAKPPKGQAHAPHSR